MSLISLADYETAASKKIQKTALDYYRSGAGDELTLNLNRTSWDRYRIRPRVMINVSKRDLSTEILGMKVSMPIAIAPTAMQKMAHPEGEKANAKAAGTAKTIFTLSTFSTSSIEEVAEAAPDTLKFFQLYIYRDRKLTEKLVRRAEKNGYKALVLTVDAPIFGLRRADYRNRFSLPPHIKLANFEDELASGVVSREGSGINEYVASQMDDNLTWKDVQWLMSFSSLPIIVKGILTREDAIIAADLGVAGIIVSNHGARQVDSTASSIEALPEIVEAVGHRVTIMMDGGVRQGTDVFKALAMGTKLVFVGRPAIWGLAVDGQKGVETVLEILRRELDITMALTGCRTVRDVKKEMVVHENFYCKL